MSEEKVPQEKASQAKPPQEKTPQARAPQAKASQEKAPQARAPQAKASQEKAPQARAPQAKASQAKESGEKPELCRGVHAEINCIIQAAIHGTSIKGDTTLYSTTFPCMACLKLVVNAGIKRLVYKEGYNMENLVKKELIESSNLIIKEFC